MTERESECRTGTVLGVGRTSEPEIFGPRMSGAACWRYSASGISGWVTMDGLVGVIQLRIRHGLGDSGGQYCMDFVFGLSILLAVGRDNLTRLLSGFRAIDAQL